ncbi:MAG: amidohydrolase family protein [Planctomycetota bacterium]|nr:amidohydrolase family protein [Planctomycetota bacterium]
MNVDAMHHIQRPGTLPLREAHAHLPSHGRSLAMLDLSQCTTRREAMERVRERAASAGDDQPWLLGVGLRIHGFVDDPTWPTRQELDAIDAARPICLMSFDHHSVVASTAAMAASGIELAAADPPGGVICRDALGLATGVLLESAAMKVWNSAPQPTLEQWHALVRLALDDLASHGFIEVHDMLSPLWLGPLLTQLDRAGALPMRVWLYAPLAELDQHVAATYGSAKVRLAGGKVFADGTLNSKTAWLLKPYRTPLPGMPCGSALLSSSQLADAMRQTASHDLGLAVHAIGDGAVRAALDAAHATRTGGLRRGVPALRIEHCELIDPADVPRFAHQRIVASVQPCHLIPDAPVLARELPDQAHRILPLRQLVDSGCSPGELLWMGSDTPIVRPHPVDSVFASMHRSDGQLPLTQDECWRAFAAP